MNYGWTRPRVVSQGATEQHTGTAEREAQEAEQPNSQPIPAPEDEEDQMEATPEGPVTQVEPNRAPRTIEPASSLRRLSNSQ